MTTECTQPFTIIDCGDYVSITMMPEASDHPDLLSAADYKWFKDLKGPTQVNFSMIQQLNSTMIAWLFQLVQWGPTGRVELSNASRRVRRQLCQYHLHHFMTFPQEDIETGLIKAVS